MRKTEIVAPRKSASNKGTDKVEVKRTDEKVKVKRFFKTNKR